MFGSDYATESEIKREKNLAKELRRTRWWQTKLQQGVCYYCSKTFEKPELSMDHIIPISRGGKSKKSNVVVACKTCNNNKKNLLPTEWQEYLDHIKKTTSV